jgi:glyoxylase-like metal-dependent hydrolase (beta-lactamase superfamily II)
MPAAHIAPALTIDPSATYGGVFAGDERICCLTAPNPGPFTHTGTNSYIIGSDRLAVIDPGPDSDAHLDALIKVISGRRVSHIFVTHTHKDHSPLAKRLAARTGALCLGEGPHRYTNGHTAGDGNALDASADLEFMPDQRLAHNELVDCGEFAIRAVATPGHAENHMAFALEGADILFSGDHVMGWATSIVAPPDGSMESYLHSLALLAKRKDRVFLPGHGGPVVNPQRHCRALKAHRLARESAILKRVQAGDTNLTSIVANVYKATDKRLHGAAALTALAHLERLAAHGKLTIGGALGMSAVFKPA